MIGAPAQRLKYHRRSVVSVRASFVPIRSGVPRPWRAALVVALLLGAARVTGAQTPTAPAPPAQPPAPASRSPLPDWLQVHAEQRTRYETIDARYRPNEVGGDQQLDFRTRFQVRVSSPRTWAYTEIQDSRIALNDSASTVGTAQVLNTHVLQLHAGLAWKDVGARKVSVQIEAGRFSRDFGFRRLIARNLYRNTTNAFDGLVGRVSGKTWAVHTLATRPVYYTYPALTRDPRFDRLRFGGLYATTNRVRQANADLYALIWRDGGAMPAADRRRLNTVGGRLFGQFGPGRRAEYELELTLQSGVVGGRAHRAWSAHAQVGHTWADTRWRPRVLALWDYASGDADPTDQRSGAFDLLMGARRFEFGPVGLYNLLPRSNLMSPSGWLLLKPTGALDTSLQVRASWLAEARDRWRSMGLVDATGAAGRHIGEQAEWRSRYRFSSHLDFDGAVTVFREGAFVRALKPSPKGRAVHLYAGLDLHY